MKNMMKVVVKKLVGLIEQQVNAKMSEEFEINYKDLKSSLVKDFDRKFIEVNSKLDKIEELKKELIDSSYKTPNQQDIFGKTKANIV